MAKISKGWPQLLNLADRLRVAKKILIVDSKHPETTLLQKKRSLRQLGLLLCGKGQSFQRRVDED